MPQQIPIKEFDYNLPDNRIARYPLAERDETRLLILRDGVITDNHFKNLAGYIPDNSLFLFNNTRVIKARLVFHKKGSNGARIEIFCLNGIASGAGYAIWKCYIGNAKKWKNEDLELTLPNSPVTLSAHRVSSEGDTYTVRFAWSNTPEPFESVLELFGNVPLPPYLNREPEEQDRARYQTIYAQHDGSVAAPTAGLHFTETVFSELQQKKCTLDYITLHVGAGTFKPVTSDDATEHTMHEEKIILTRQTLLRLIQNLQNTIVAVGTTSMRSLESIYWLGIQILQGNTSLLTETGDFSIDQWEPYHTDQHIPAVDALTAVYDYMKTSGLSTISGFTRIMIVPGYRFRVCKALVTNFHQPQSTLLLLVSAFIGDSWKKVYQHALDNDYRFLSYGDACLFYPQNNGE